MNKKISWKTVGLALLFPHTFLVFLMFNITLVVLLYIFLNQLEDSVPASCFYAVAFYTLVIVCARIPRIVKKVQNVLHSNKYTHRYLTDEKLRRDFSIYKGLIINIFFAIFKIVLGVIYNTPWLYAMAGYNTMLSLMRFVVVFRTREKGLSREEQDKYDEKALCRFMGKLMFAYAGCFVVIALGNVLEQMALVWLGIILMIVICIAAVIYANKGNRFKRK